MIKRYTIQPGDNAYTISQKLYGSGRFAPLITATIRDTPLMPGYILSLPDKVGAPGEYEYLPGHFESYEEAHRAGLSRRVCAYCGTKLLIREGALNCDMCGAPFPDDKPPGFSFEGRSDPFELQRALRRVFQEQLVTWHV